MSRIAGAGGEPGHDAEGGGQGRGAVLLVGHGSHHGPESAWPVHDLARRLRKDGFDEVRVGFWKEDPHLHAALEPFESSDVVVVPVFTSTGYFTEVVVPRELGLDGPVTVRDGRTIRLRAPVGSSAEMDDLVLERAREAAPLSAEERSAATLVVIGHGTDAHPRSGDTTRAIVRRLREREGWGHVVEAFLDQEPRLGSVVERLAQGADPSRNAVLVPFFVSDGWHVGTTVPASLALDGGRTVRNGSVLWYARPVGTHPWFAQVVAAAARSGPDAGGGPAGREAPGGAARRRATPSDAAGARAEFTRWIESSGPAGRVVLEVRIVPSGGGRFHVRHVADLDRSPSELRELLDPEEGVRVSARTMEGEHRPLRTAPTLPGGWRLEHVTAEEVWDFCGYVYPTVLVHRHLALRGRLGTAGFRETASRQTGIYAATRSLDDSDVENVVRETCGPARCLRSATWAGPALEAATSAAGPRGGGVGGADGAGGAGGVAEAPIPCPEPCSVLLSAARELAADRAGGSSASLDSPPGSA